MGTEYVLTEDDQPAADASLVEDIVELQLLTAGEKTGPVGVHRTSDAGNH